MRVVRAGICYLAERLHLVKPRSWCEDFHIPEPTQTQVRLFNARVMPLDDDDDGTVKFVASTPREPGAFMHQWDAYRAFPEIPHIDFPVVPLFDFEAHTCTGDDSCIFCSVAPPSTEPERYMALSARSEGAAEFVAGFDLGFISPHALTTLFGYEESCVRGEPHEGQCVPPNIALGDE